MKTQNTLLGLILVFGLNYTASAREKNYNMNMEMDSITYLEEESVILDIDTAAYLPEGFNPYAAPSNFQHVSFIEDAVEIELGFDTKKYLPAGFNPHQYFFDIHSIDYIEDHDLLEHDFTI